MIKIASFSAFVFLWMDNGRWDPRGRLKHYFDLLFAVDSAEVGPYHEAAESAMQAVVMAQKGFLTRYGGKQRECSDTLLELSPQDDVQTKEKAFANVCLLHQYIHLFIHSCIHLSIPICCFSLRTQGDGSNAPTPAMITPISQDSMTSSRLSQLCGLISTLCSSDFPPFIQMVYNVKKQIILFLLLLIFLLLPSSSSPSSSPSSSSFSSLISPSFSFPL